MKIAMIVYGDVSDTNDAGELLIDSETLLDAIESEVERVGLPAEVWPTRPEGHLVGVKLMWGGVTVREVVE